MRETAAGGSFTSKAARGVAPGTAQNERESVEAAVQRRDYSGEGEAHQKQAVGVAHGGGSISDALEAARGHCGGGVRQRRSHGGGEVRHSEYGWLDARATAEGCAGVAARQPGAGEAGCWGEQRTDAEKI